MPGSAPSAFIGLQFHNQPSRYSTTCSRYQHPSLARMQSIPRQRRLLKPFAGFRNQEWTSVPRSIELQETTDETIDDLGGKADFEMDDNNSASTPRTCIDSDEESADITSSVQRNSQNPLSPFDLGMPADSILLLNLVAIIWGSQHAVIKTCIQDLDPASFSFVRFLFGSLIATPAWLMSSPSQKPDSKAATAATNGTIWRWGLELGLWMFLGYAFQAVGLESTTAQRSGFFLYLNVKFVPFFAYLLVGRSISLPTWISAFTALIGTGLLAYDGTSVFLNQGDWWSIAAAASSAMFILRLEAASSSVQNAAGLNAACLWVVTGASLIWLSTTGLLNMDQIVKTVMSHPSELLYLSAVTTALANWIQTKAQRNVTAERASVIYAMDPVWGAIWANILLGETLTGFGMVGAAFITIAAATNAFLDFGSTKKI